MHMSMFNENRVELLLLAKLQVWVGEQKTHTFLTQLQISFPDQQLMRAFLFRGTVRSGFFWKKTPKKNELDALEEEVKASPVLGHLIDNIRKLNENKSSLLPPQLPQHEGKLTVVMELDQVLSYTFTPDDEGYLLSPLRRHDHYTEFDEYNACLSIYKRKNLQNFLNYISEECEPVLWSTGVQSYVDLMLTFIDPKKKIPYVLTQETCNLVENKQQQIDVFIKDLNLLGRDLSRVVYIDSKPMSFWMYPDNCFPTEQFRADQTMETEDLNLMILELEALREAKDVRKVLKERFQLRELLKDVRLI